MKYFVKEGSESHHCCFEYTVVFDDEDGKEPPICETFDKESAYSICEALNHVESIVKVSVPPEKKKIQKVVYIMEDASQVASLRDSALKEHNVIKRVKKCLDNIENMEMVNGDIYYLMTAEEANSYPNIFKGYNFTGKFVHGSLSDDAEFMLKNCMRG